MKELKREFRFDLRGLLSSARRMVGTRVDGVTINLPFLSFDVRPDDLERKVAREVLIRMKDRRVLDAKECCDECIDRALASLQEIRTLLIEKQVELLAATDGPAYLLLEVMLEAIRQFLSFEERLNATAPGGDWKGPGSRSFREREVREAYFAALEMLRSHLGHSMAQVAKLAGVELPKVQFPTRYDDSWQIDAYEPLPQLTEGTPLS